MRTLDDHVASRVHINARWVTRVGVYEPNYNWDVIGYAMETHGDGSVGLKKIDAASVVVSENGGFGFERREGSGERKKVLTDEPFGVLGVRKRRRASLRKDGA